MEGKQQSVGPSECCFGFQFTQQSKTSSLASIQFYDTQKSAWSLMQILAFTLQNCVQQNTPYLLKAIYNLSHLYGLI